MNDPRARVRAVLAAARLLADPHHALGRAARERLPEVTGLSERGVDLALREHLESDASDDEIARLIGSVPPASNVHVVLSANVFVAALRAIALALAATDRVFVRPSRREPVFAELIARALDESGDAAKIEIVDDIMPRRGDCVHVYGHDSTIDAFRSALEPEVPVWGHGTGFGVAAIDAIDLEETQLEIAIDALVRDVVPFDQRGCLSPRVLLLRASEVQAERAAEMLCESLESAASRVPVGAVDDDDRIRRRSYLDVMSAVGLSFEVGVGGVGVDPSPTSLTLPGSPRTIHVARVDDVEHVRKLISPVERSITALGGEGAFAESIATQLRRARRSKLGEMQRPRLDGPVDLRAQGGAGWTDGPLTR